MWNWHENLKRELFKFELSKKWVETWNVKFWKLKVNIKIWSFEIEMVNWTLNFWKIKICKHVIVENWNCTFWKLKSKFELLKLNWIIEIEIFKIGIQIEIWTSENWNGKLKI